MNNDSEGGIYKRTCGCCGKTILMMSPVAWKYIRKYGSKRKYFCSWNCYNKGAVRQEELK